MNLVTILSLIAFIVVLFIIIKSKFNNYARISLISALVVCIYFATTNNVIFSSLGGAQLYEGIGLLAMLSTIIFGFMGFSKAKRTSSISSAWSALILLLLIFLCAVFLLSILAIFVLPI